MAVWDYNILTTKYTLTTELAINIEKYLNVHLLFCYQKVLDVEVNKWIAHLFPMA